MSADANTEHESKSSLRKWLMIGGPAAVVVLAGAYVGLAASQSGKIQRGTAKSAIAQFELLGTLD